MDVDNARFDQFNAMVLKLYRASAETPLASFQDTALEILKPLVPFETSMWGTAVYEAGKGLDIHTIHLHNQSHEMLEAYAPLKHMDTCADQVSGLPSVTKGFHSPTVFADPKKRVYREFLTRFGHENVLISAQTDMHTGFTQWVTLFRADADQYSRPEELSLLAHLAPHLMQGLRQNRALHLAKLDGGTLHCAQNGGPVHAAAIADARGVVHHATPGWDEMLRTEWGAALHSGRLPAALRDWLCRTEAPFMGRTLAARRHVQKDLLFVSLRPLCAADRLTRRQHEIAQLVAQGFTHKQTAQRLGLSPATVRNQIQDIYRRLEVQNVAALVLALDEARW